MDGISRSFSSQARPVVGALCLWLASMSASWSQEPMPVTVVAAKEAEVTEKIPVVGSLAAREEVQVYPLIEDRAIVHILVEVGRKVEKGQPLALLDQTVSLLLLDKNAVSGQRADAAVAVEASRLDVAMVTLREALKVVERSRALQPKGAVSQQVLDEHENAYARAVAECALAQQSLSLARADAALIARERDEIELSIERSTVRAPENGIVLRRTARIGAMASISGNPLFVLARDAAVEFVAQVTETSFARLGEGMPAEVSVTGYDGTIDGIVRLNAAELDPVTRSGEVRIDLGGATSLKPGMFARGSISGLARRNIVLPGSAVTTAGGKSNVFIIDNDVVDLRAVTIGARQDDLVEILNGVREGEMVVLKSGGFLKADEKVRPVLASSAQQPSDRLASSFMIEATEIAR